jgi:hypothetical protein
VHYGWIVVGAAFTALFLTYGVQYAFGLFFLAGWLFDTTGAYVAAFGLGAALNLLSLTLEVLAHPPASRPA